MSMYENNDIIDQIEIPQYFICPISLQIMQDPVTTVTGITYDRESIEKWLLATCNCPVTKQPLPKDSDLTPNHMLRRLIQAWCTANAKYGIDRIPTPKSPVTKALVVKLIRDLDVPQLYKNSLKKIDELVNEDERNRKFMSEESVGVAKAMIKVIMKCSRERKTTGLEEALRILHLIWNPTSGNKQLISDYNIDLIQALLAILKSSDDKMDNNIGKLQAYAIIVLKMITEAANSNLLESLKLDFFEEMVSILRGKRISQQAVKAALHVLIEVCPLGRNRIKIIEAGAIFELIELELTHPDKKTTELIFCLLANLCSCADGRAAFLSHHGSIAVVSKKILKVSPATDDRALHILGLIARFSATKEVLLEMLRVSSVSKLCMVLQADCEGYMKKQAREILRLHSNVWSKSPCIQVYLLTS